MPKMRILEIIDVRWWNACAYYGVSLAQGLARAGDDVVVAASPGSPPAAVAGTLGLRTWTDVRFADPNPLKTAVDFPALVRGIRDFDIIDAHRAEGHALGALASGLANGPPVVRTRGDIRAPRRNPLSNFVHRKLTAAVIVPGTFMQRRLILETGLDADRVVVIPAGIDLDHYSIQMPEAIAEESVKDVPEWRHPRHRNAFRQSLGIPEAAPLIGMVARFSPVKGHRVMLAALARLGSAGPRPHLVLAGQDAELSAPGLAAEASALGIRDRVHWLGYQEDVRPLLAALDIVAVPSLGSEAISRVVLEAMAMSVPVIASSVGVIPELLLEGETGLLVPPGDAAALAGALGTLLADPGRARAMGARARARAEDEYGLERWVERTRAVYRHVIESRGERST